MARTFVHRSLCAPPQVNDRGAGRGPLSSAGAVVMIAGTGARKRNIPCDNQKAVVRCSTSVGSGIDVRASEERRCVKFYNLDAMLIIGRTSRISLFCWNCGLPIEKSRLADRKFLDFASLS